MLIIDVEDALLDESEKIFLLKRCENFTAYVVPNKNNGTVNYFYREFLDMGLNEVKSIKQKVEKFICASFNDQTLIVDGIWINRVNVNSNKNDDFHYDNSLASCVVYLNDDFEGGEFEYKDTHNNQIKVIPKKYMLIGMTDKLKHRVLPVKNGVRYSLVFFFTKIDKVKKTLI